MPFLAFGSKRDLSVLSTCTYAVVPQIWSLVGSNARPFMFLNGVGPLGESANALVGDMFLRNVACESAISQYRCGFPAAKRSVLIVSVALRIHLSQRPFLACVCGGAYLTLMRFLLQLSRTYTLIRCQSVGYIFVR